MTTKRPKGILAGAAVVLLLLPACAVPENTAPRVGEPIAAYGASSLAGDSLTLADLEGKAVLLNMWATWCAPCRFETPYLQAVSEEFGPEGLEVVGVSMDTGDVQDQVQDFVEEYGVTYSILVDPQMRAMETFQVLGLPATFLVDRQGVLRWMRIGPIAEHDPDFLAALETVLK